MNDPVSPPEPSPAPAPAPTPRAVEQRIAHLFRGSRQRGLIHPLEHIVQQLRRETAPAEAELPRS